MRRFNFCQDSKKNAAEENNNTRILSMAEIHEFLFEMLRTFADYCDAHGVRYYLISGTLLGAIRHEDFIPWDNDADILIPRPDYMRLLEWIKREPVCEPYTICSNEYGTLCFPYSKILDTRICAEHKGITPFLWIDIYPMDGLPENERKCRFFLRRAKILKSSYWCARRGPYKDKTPLRTVCRFIYTCYARARGVKYWVAKQDQMAKTYDFEQSAYIGGVCYSMGPCERMKKEDFLPQVEVKFHGSVFHAPACWDKYLTAMYGNYMELPPESKRVPHKVTFMIRNIVGEERKKV